MKLADLFQNAMRLTSELEHRRFADDAAYRETLEKELCGDAAPGRPSRKASAAKAEADPEDESWALSH